MIGNNCLLDTSIIIDAFRQNQKISSRLDKMDNVFVPAIVLGELYFGAYRSANLDKHLAQLHLFFSQCKILSTDETVANHYGKIKAKLVGKRKPIPENDIWIAATAIQYNLPLYTTDGHFKEIEELSLL